MGSIRAKIEYLEATKKAIRDAIVAKGVAVADTDTFRSYADKIDSIKGTSHTTPTNTYEKGTLAGKVAYLLDTKEAIRRAIVAAGVEVSTTTKFRDYANKISQIQSPIISFVIRGTTFQAREGTTWEEWVLTDYNTVNMQVETDPTYLAVYYTENDSVQYTICNTDSSFVKPTDVIIADYTYSTFKEPI